MTLKPSAEDSAALVWTKSSYSTNDGPECVEVAATAATVRVRDSKDVEGPQLAVSRDTWRGFVARVVAG